MKKVIATMVFTLVVAILYIRYEAIQLAKQAYILGCSDTSVLLANLGEPNESVKVEKFCIVRKKMLDTYLGFF